MLSVVLEILALLYKLMLHYQDMHNPVLLPQSWASLHWIFWKRFPLAVCEHSPAHAPKAEPWAVLKSMAQQSRARIALHSLQVSHAFSRCTPKLFFPTHLEHKVEHWIIATQSNLPTADFFQRVNTTTEFCTYRGASFQIYTQENTSHYIFWNYRQYSTLSPSLPDVSISLYSSQHRNRNQYSILFFFLKSSNGQNTKHCLMCCRKLHGNLHTEIHTQHLERVSLHLGSTEMTMLLLVLFEVSGKKEKKQRDH